MILPPYRVSAFNTSKASENKIHDGATAQRLGFNGGFVGGVNIYGYMTHQPLQRWGRAWLERGTGEAKFIKPVYENDIAEVTAVEDADGLTLTVYSQGVLCTTGRAAMGTNPPPVGLSDFKSVSPRADRTQADEHSLKVGEWFGISPMLITEANHTQDLEDLRETDPINETIPVVAATHTAIYRPRQLAEAA